MAYGERHVFPIRVGVGHAQRLGHVLLHIVYKLGPGEQEEFEQRYALTKDQATLIAQDLLAMVENLPRS